VGPARRHPGLGGSSEGGSGCNSGPRGLAPNPLSKSANRCSQMSAWRRRRGGSRSETRGERRRTVTTETKTETGVRAYQVRQDPTRRVRADRRRRLPPTAAAAAISASSREPRCEQQPRPAVVTVIFGCDALIVHLTCLPREPPSEPWLVQNRPGARHFGHHRPCRPTKFKSLLRPPGIERVWSGIQDRHRDVPKVVVALLAPPRSGSLAEC
jgi:hypothetical protein